MIGKNERVSVEYKGMLEDGTVFESSEEMGPMDITTGCNQVIEGLDDAIQQMEVGEMYVVTIPPEHAFGEYDPNNIQKRELRYIPNADQLPVGQRIRFMGPGGQPISALVQKIEDGYAYLDFNNKLAGHTLTYELTVTEILPQKTRRTPISDYGPMARTTDTRPVEEEPVFNNFLMNLGITPEDIDRRYEEIREEREQGGTAASSDVEAEIFIDKADQE